MQMERIGNAGGDTAEERASTKLSPIGFSARHVGEAQGFRRALQALNAAYAKVGNALCDRLQHAGGEAAELPALGASYTWISDRRRLVQTYLEAEPAVIAYACADCTEPEQIRSLAEAAADLAGETGSLVSALGILNYIDRELGWAAVCGAPAGHA
jgi:NAD(P)-dependent dehydrogenase (short-subunit alcohol dehydrogenase family)